MSVRVLLVVCVVAVSTLACSPNRGTFDVAPVDVSQADRNSEASSDAASCTAPNSLCGEACVNVQNDRDHCGTCGHACAAGQSCAMGACALVCPSPQVACGGLCTITATDRFNCGMCGRACPAGQVCSAGACSLDCATGLTTCMGSSTGDAGTSRFCADTHVDRSNCGSCGHACSAGQNCVSSACVTMCPAAQTLCSGLCIDVMTNPAHCGACGAACPGGQVCAGGTCGMACPTGSVYCTDRCVNVQNDRTNCGACGNACAAGSVCAAGACVIVCPTGTTDCGGVCVDTATDATHCGSCSTACPSGQVCSAGACAATCAPGTTSCGGNCVDLTNDRTHCGACATACAADQFCVGGACGASCLPGQTACGGHCVDLTSDPANCGYCGGTCGDGYACSASYCRPLEGTDASGCSPPSRQCGTTCTDVRNDNNNCGACGTVCSADRTCVVSMCVAPCLAGEARCGATCSRIASDRNNCGACGNVCPAGLSCAGGVCVVDPTFRVTSMANTACVLSADEQTPAGDDCGGLAVGNTTVFYTGDSRTVVLPASDLGTITTVMPPEAPGRYIGLVSDSRSGEVYTLLDAAGAVQPTASFTSAAFTITQLGLLDPTTGNLTATRLALSAPIVFGTSGVGIYSGFGRFIVFTNAADASRGWYNIDLPSGRVRTIRTGAGITGAPSAMTCETFAHFGVAEYFDGEYHVLYMRSGIAPTGVFRYTPSTNIADATPVMNAGGSIGDICMVAFAPARNRWYFHYEAAPTWAPPPAGTFGEFVGYCAGTWDAP